MSTTESAGMTEAAPTATSSSIVTGSRLEPSTVANEKNRARSQPMIPSGLGFTSQIVFIESCNSANTPVAP